MRGDELLGVLTEASPMSVAYVDAQQRYRYASRVYGQQFNCTTEQVIGRSVREVLGPAMYEEVHGHIDAALAGRTVIYESCVHPPEAGEHRLSITLIPHLTAAEGVSGFVVFASDITERREAEESLRVSEANSRARLAELEHVFRTSPVGLAMHDRERRLVRISERLAAIDGLSVEEHFGRTLSEILPAVGAKVDPIVQRVLDTGDPALDLELEVPDPVAPQSRFVGLASFHPLKSAEGVVQAVSAAVLDITERKRLEEALRANEQRLSNILDSAMDAIVTVDEGGAVRLFNAAAESMFGCAAGEALGCPLDRFITPGFRAFLGEWIDSRRRGKTQARRGWAPAGLALRRAGGEEVPVEATISRADAAGQALYTLVVRDVNERLRAQEELRRLQVENVHLREEAGVERDPPDLVGATDGLARVLQAAGQVATTDSTVLITGETGTGKELIARIIHARSERSQAVLVKVNCAALPASLIESELFGHEKGAFTGALARKVGRFELAAEGTIFLDEIGDLPLELQPKLLRVLQEGELERIGGVQTIKVDVRVIAATNRDLAAEVEAQRFRADLFYRLNVFPIHLPPLRERRNDVPLLVRHLVMKLARKLGRRIETIPKETLNALAAYDWPGNVRELQNVIERGVILSTGPGLELGDWLPNPAQAAGGRTGISTLAELERRHILDVLRRTGWRVSGPRGAAKLLGLKPTTLEARMKKHGIARPAD